MLLDSQARGRRLRKHTEASAKQRFGATLIPALTAATCGPRQRLFPNAIEHFAAAFADPHQMKSPEDTLRGERVVAPLKPLRGMGKLLADQPYQQREPRGPPAPIEKNALKIVGEALVGHGRWNQLAFAGNLRVARGSARHEAISTARGKEEDNADEAWPMPRRK
jgi:hypothetical protein